LELTLLDHIQALHCTYHFVRELLLHEQVMLLLLLL
jgi:hypothetical protein